MSRPRGRPTKYRQSLAKAICIRLMLGQSLNEICRLPQYPGKVSVFAWLQKYPDFMNQYRRAREIQQESHLDEIFEIADDGTNDWMERTDREGKVVGWQINGEHVQRSKLRIDTRKWVMERMAPKRFGAIKEVSDEEPAQSLNISFEVREPVRDVKVTNAKT